MRNWKSDGGTVNMFAPAGGVVSGQPYLLGDFFAVANETKTAGVLVGFTQFGVFYNQPKTTGETWAQGDRLFWDTSTLKLSNAGSGSGRFLVGYAEGAASASATLATAIYNQGGR